MVTAMITFRLLLIVIFIINQGLLDARPAFNYERYSADQSDYYRGNKKEIMILFASGTDLKLARRIGRENLPLVEEILLEVNKPSQVHGTIRSKCIFVLCDNLGKGISKARLDEIILTVLNNFEPENDLYEPECYYLMDEIAGNTQFFRNVKVRPVRTRAAYLAASVYFEGILEQMDKIGYFPSKDAAHTIKTKAQMITKSLKSDQPDWEPLALAASKALIQEVNTNKDIVRKYGSIIIRDFQTNLQKLITNTLEFHE